MTDPAPEHTPAGSPPTDAELIAAGVAGDRTAATELLKRHGGTVRSRLAGKISPVWQSVVDADDVMQVTYLEAFLRLPSFQPRHEGSFLAWLTLIAENNLRDAIKELERQKRPNPRHRVDAAGSGDSYVALVELLGATLTTPSLQAHRGEIHDALECALAKLPSDYAKVVRLYDLEGRDAKEVADAIGRSPGAVYMLLARAHERLKDVLGTESRFFTRA
ncbi:MAG: sigma-70 family RNA polymerase sigma factor [Planctomycetota bacterium]|nr:sigma-70 family RNA polymerase sigma factor [Planctomycetota bacterium]